MLKHTILSVLLALSANKSVRAEPLEKWPEWDLSQETDAEKPRYFLEPPDGRPTIAVTEGVASRMQAGSLHPNDAYRAPENSTRNQDGVNQASSGESGISKFGSGSDSGSGTPSGGSNYKRLGAPSGGNADANRSLESPDYNTGSASMASGKLDGNADAAVEKFSDDMKKKAEEVVIATKQEKAKDVNVAYKEAQAPPKPKEPTIVNCSSWSYKPATCDTGKKIKSATVHQKQSRSACSEGSSWSFSGTAISVKSGCRANFAVVHE